ncbi:hypothetical protein [Bacteroides sp.]
MNITIQEQKQAEKLLLRNNIQLQDIESFSFMKRYHMSRKSLTPKDKYGAGVLTLHLKQDTEKSIYLTVFRHPTSVIRYLLSHEIPFDNYSPTKRTAGIIIPEKKYCHSSLYILYFVSLFIVFAILGCKMIASDTSWGIIPGIVSLTLSAFLLYALLTRFGYLTLTNETLTINSIGRKVSFPYDSLRKVNFDYARERTFTYTMEVLGNDYDYHLYYIGRVPRRKLEEITKYLQQAGIDATCYIEQDKRFYHDSYSKH